jgi:putative Holliday junction resolvase
MKILGVDYGSRRIGLAITDETEILALAHGVVEDLEGVVRAARETGAGKIVVGLPLNMNGSKGPAARRAEGFARRLAAATGLPVETVDERLSSDEAERRLAEAPLGRRRKREHVNVVAAQVILETYLAARR